MKLIVVTRRVEEPWRGLAENILSNPRDKEWPKMRQQMRPNMRNNIKTTWRQFWPRFGSHLCVLLGSVFGRDSGGYSVAVRMNEGCYESDNIM